MLLGSMGNRVRGQVSRRSEEVVLAGAAGAVSKRAIAMSVDERLSVSRWFSACAWKLRWLEIFCGTMEKSADVFDFSL